MSPDSAKKNGSPVSSRRLPRREPQSGVLRLDASTEWPLYDLVVIGGGINGTGIARDAAQRGLTVLLLEKQDFGAGASAYSSRLIHGGLRYLANLEFDLVRESLRERALLLKNAPHLVKPLPMAIPVYRNGQNPLWKIELGMLLYDVLSWGKSMPPHRLLNRAEFEATYPGVHAEGLQGGPVYYDAQVLFPERICIENVIAAMETGNATMLNHARVDQLGVDNQTLTSLRFQDTLSGQCHTVRGRVFINASGPWVDELLQLSIAQDSEHIATHSLRPRMGGTKGTHIVVRRFSGAPETALYAEARTDGRPFFILPWLNETLLIGTTDTRYMDDLDAVIPTDDEVAYLLAETNTVLPQAHLTAASVLYAYAGIRPLPYAEGKKAGKITRKHWIVDHAQDPAWPVAGLISIIGGKLTTYRNLAEEAVDYAALTYHLSLPNGMAPPSGDTRHRPLPGGEGILNWTDYLAKVVPELCASAALDPNTVQGLLSLYGSRAHAVLALLQENPAWIKPLPQVSVKTVDAADMSSGSPQVLAVQVVYAVRCEMACSLEDVLLRRIGAGLNPDLGFSIMHATAQLMAALMEWDEPRMLQEVQCYEQDMTTRNLSFRAKLLTAQA